jgi:NAD-dependent dihydropyrimidine dehydrogenase PreA subunit
MSTDNGWQGIPRNKIPWHPTVDVDACTGCGECYDFCGHGVYAWDDGKNKSVVSRPNECVVGCSSCLGMCPSGAISFPPLARLRDLKAKYRA